LHRRKNKILLIFSEPFYERIQSLLLGVTDMAVPFTGLPLGWGTGKDDVMAADSGRYELSIFIWQHIECNEKRAVEHA
jgi:hypothetical protein